MLKSMPDKKYLDLFFKKCLENIALITEKKRKNKDLKTIFTIGSDALKDNSFLPYVTPVRLNRYHAITGAVVFSGEQAILLAKLLDGSVDIIAVDAEKKIPIISVLNRATLPKEVFEIFNSGANKTVDLADSGNIASVCHGIIKKSDFFEFKANDLTVEAVWTFVSNKLKDLSHTKIAIIGAGNIGTKLALKFVECGANVSINRRDKYSGNTIANAINLIKPELTIASVSYSEDKIKTCFMADVIIGSTYGVPAIDWNHIAVSKENSIIIDVGKGSIKKEAIIKAFMRGKHIYRLDVASALEGHLFSLVRNDELTKNAAGRKTVYGVNLVSGGILGLEGDIVVDNVRNPKRILGIANGTGDMAKSYKKKDLKKIRTLKRKLRLKDNLILLRKRAL